MSQSLTRTTILAAIGAAMLLLAGCATSEVEPEPEAITTLPVNEPPAAAAPAEPASDNDVAPTANIYVVQPNDSLASIAESEGVTLAQLLELNDVPSPSVIEPGLELLLPPGPAAEPERVRPVRTRTIPTPATASVDQAWYEGWRDRIPALPSQLDPAQPILLALGVIALTIVGVGVVAIGVPMLHGMLTTGASGVAIGGGRLQAALAGVPRDSAPAEAERAERRRPRLPRIPAVHWPSRLRFSSSAAATVAHPVSLPSPGVPAPAGSRVRLPDGPNESPVGTSHGAPSAATAPHTGSALARTAGRGWAALRHMAVSTSSTTANAVRSLGRQVWFGLVVTGRFTRRLLEAAGAILLQVARATGSTIVTLAQRAAAVPARRFEARRDARERRRFRDQVQSTTAARLRLGLRDDAEAYLQQSLDESLRVGWRLEAAWCLQLMAEEADRRGERALAELRRVRGRELIREHALEEEADA